MDIKRIDRLIKKSRDNIPIVAVAIKELFEIKHFLFKITPSTILIKYSYKKKFGKKLNLKNPKKLSEKLQWKKAYDKQDIYTTCADKYKVRAFVRERVGEKYLIPLMFNTKKPKEIIFDNLELPFIIKSNHGSGQNIIVKTTEDINKKAIIKKCKKWLKTNYYSDSKEWQYKNITPRILIEKLLLNDKGNIPEDYKLHCFDGKVSFIQVDTDRFSDHKRSFFDVKWNLLPFTWSPKKNGKPAYHINKSIRKPHNLSKMINITEKLSKDFDYIRVDLYSINNKIYFGELTFTHGSGFEMFFPKKWDKFYGEKLILKNENRK